jgi:dTDP-4-dehydrorhamnose reductase
VVPKQRAVVEAPEKCMTWILLGSSGQLGKSLQQVLTEQGMQFHCCSHADVEITNIDSVRDAVSSVNPSVVVNLAAWTNVDSAESKYSEAFSVNAFGAENVAKVAAERGLPLIHISTDYVFDGLRTTPYRTTDSTNPLSVYGKSKNQGEILVRQAHPNGSWIVRTAWLYSPFGKNFAKAIIRKALLQEDISVVNDVFGQPTSARALAEQLVLMVSKNIPRGIYHGTNSGQASWFDFAEALTQSMNLSTPIAPLHSSELPSIAPRPSYSVLDHSEWISVGMDPMPAWQESLEEVLPGLITSVQESMS